MTVNIRKGWIKVTIEPLNYGGYVMMIADKYHDKFAAVVRANGGGCGRTFGYRVAFPYIAHNEDLPEMPRRKRKALDDGYHVTILMDPWDVGHYYGYDAHTVAENGMSLKGMNL